MSVCPDYVVSMSTVLPWTCAFDERSSHFDFLSIFAFHFRHCLYCLVVDSLYLIVVDINFNSHRSRSNPGGKRETEINLSLPVCLFLSICICLCLCLSFPLCVCLFVSFFPLSVSHCRRGTHICKHCMIMMIRKGRDRPTTKRSIELETNKVQLPGHIVLSII